MHPKGSVPILPKSPYFKSELLREDCVVQVVDTGQFVEWGSVCAEGLKQEGHHKKA